VLEEAINVTALCDELKLSRRQVERKFRAYFQCSPHHMLTRMRIERAKKRLLETQLSIADIDVQSGFTDVARFSAVFRRMEQQSPSQWRRART
jgi:LacI family transcriptional regulator